MRDVNVMHAFAADLQPTGVRKWVAPHQCVEAEYMCFGDESTAVGVASADPVAAPTSSTALSATGRLPQENG